MTQFGITYIGSKSGEKKAKASPAGATHTKNEILFANPAAAKLLESMGAKTFPNTGARRAHR
jgi:hypothetical protein